MEELLAIRTDTELVEIVVPVHNEAQTLEATVARLRQYLDRSFPFPTVVTIADNASIDGTDALAEVPGSPPRRSAGAAPRREGPGPGAAHVLDRQSSGSRGVHGRRSGHRPRGTAPARRSALVRPQ